MSGTRNQHFLIRKYCIQTFISARTLSITIMPDLQTNSKNLPTPSFICKQLFSFMHDSIIKQNL